MTEIIKASGFCSLFVQAEAEHILRIQNCLQFPTYAVCLCVYAPHCSLLISSDSAYHCPHKGPVFEVLSRFHS